MFTFISTAIGLPIGANGSCGSVRLTPSFCEMMLPTRVNMRDMGGAEGTTNTRRRFSRLHIGWHATSSRLIFISPAGFP